MRFCHPSAVLAHEGETPLRTASAALAVRSGVSPSCAKTALGWQNLIPRVSKGAFDTGFTTTCVVKNDTVGMEWGCRPSPVSRRRGHAGSKVAGSTPSPSHWIFFFLRRFFSIRVRALRTVRRAAEARRARPTKFGRSDSLHMISADVACSKVILCAHLALNNAKSPPSPHHSPRRPRTMEPPGGHFARAPTSPVILRTIKDHFLGRSRINSSNEMGVKWVYKREHTLSRAVLKQWGNIRCNRKPVLKLGFDTSGRKTSVKSGTLAPDAAPGARRGCQRPVPRAQADPGEVREARNRYERRRWTRVARV